MTIKSLLPALLAGSLLSVSATTAAPEADRGLEGKIRTFYQHMNEGEFEKAFKFVEAGSNGFLPHGMIIEIKNEAVHAKVIEKLQAERSAGRTLALSPKHVTIRTLGEESALATYYVDGTVTEAGSTTPVMRRVSLVLSRTGGDWKIVHWHSSHLTTEEEAVAAN